MVRARRVNNNMKTDNRNLDHMMAPEKDLKLPMACTSADAGFASEEFIKKTTSAGSQESFGKIVDERPGDIDDQEIGAEDADIDAKLMKMRKSLAMARGSAKTKTAIGKLMKTFVGRSVTKRRAASVT